MTSFDQNNVGFQHWMECYNEIGGLDDDDPHDINIPKSKGTRLVEGLGI